MRIALLFVCLVGPPADDPAFDAKSAPSAVTENHDRTYSLEVEVTASRPFRPDAAGTGVITASEIERRPFHRAGEILETVPGVVVSQHSGEGKANQYYLRGFNLDHGTDIALTVAGVPVNMPTHAHGQGYADANFLIPELIESVEYRKGPYFAESGDFSSAGAVEVQYLSRLDKPLLVVEGGAFDHQRLLFAQSAAAGGGVLLYALEGALNDGPWEQPDRLRKWNAFLRYSKGRWSITGMAYDARWSATDQIPVRAVEQGLVSRFGSLDPTDGGTTHRYSLSADWQRTTSSAQTELAAYAVDYQLDLFSNFTYFLDDPVNGDQFEQADDRMTSGFHGSHRWLSRPGAVTVESVAGAEVRRDDIRSVGLYRTRERERLSTVRHDSLTQTSTALYAQMSVQWTDRLRTVTGLRADHYDFGPSADAIISPKLSLVARLRRNNELYVNAGYGFHSNDARVGGDDRLVRTRGGEIGLRTALQPNMQVTTSAWGLAMDSELVFVGDAGATEARGASRRVGLEVATSIDVTSWLGIEGEYARSRARFRGGDRIPGAVEAVASAAVILTSPRGLAGEVRYRHLGARPLAEDNSIRSDPSKLVSTRLSYALTPRVRLAVDVFNLTNAKASDVEYFYVSRLPGEPSEGVADLHVHPVEPRSVRMAISTRF